MPTQLQGTLRIILEPLLVDKPFVGAVTVFFLQKPVSPRERRGPAVPCESALACWAPGAGLSPRMELPKAGKTGCSSCSSHVI